MKPSSVLIACVSLAAAGACKKDGGAAAGPAFTHENPSFSLDVPASFKAGRDLKNMDGDGGNLSFRNGGQEIFLIWTKRGAPTDPVANGFGRHEAHGILERGKLPAGAGEWVVVDRKSAVYVHALMYSGDWGIECTVVNAPKDAPKAVLDSCKSLRLR